MEPETDALTRWWRGISLRAKITGATVSVLTLCLFSVGLGAVPFLQRAFEEQIDAALQQSSGVALVDQLFAITADGSSLYITPRQTSDATGTNLPYAALYAEDGSMAAVNNRPSSDMVPAYPPTVTLTTAAVQQDPFKLPSDSGRADAFRALVTTIAVSTDDGQKQMFTLLVALPTSQIDADIATYLTIFLMLAVIAIIAGGLLTRWIVTLAFRRLGQVESTAMAIAAGNFSQRMPGAESHTEVGRLKLAINTMLGRMDAALAQRDDTVSQMRRFVGDASHELRTPLVTVRGYAELYRMGAIRGEEDTAQAMDRIEKEAIRMGTLVEDLLALARLDEKRALVFSSVDLRPIARDAALDVRAAAPDRTGTYLDYTAAGTVVAAEAAVAAEETPDAAGKRRAPATAALFQAGATLGRRFVRRKPGEESVPKKGDTGPLTPTDLDVDRLLGDLTLEPVVLGQEDKLRQVVANLVGNARRYTPQDSPIEIAVGVDRATETGWIAVIDHGDGIPEQQRSKIFERFWRADTSRTRETGGSGLGLAIVASIVQALRGTIAVEETPGGGATFRVSIPLAQTLTREEHAQLETQPLSKLVLGADGRPLPTS